MLINGLNRFSRGGITAQNGWTCKPISIKIYVRVKMPKASDNSSQPYRNADRCFEMAGKNNTHTNTLAVMQGTLSPTSPIIKAGYSISLLYAKWRSERPTSS